MDMPLYLTTQWKKNPKQLFVLLPLKMLANYQVNCSFGSDG